MTNVQTKFRRQPQISSLQHILPNIWYHKQCGHETSSGRKSHRESQKPAHKYPAGPRARYCGPVITKSGIILENYNSTTTAMWLAIHDILCN